MNKLIPLILLLYLGVSRPAKAQMPVCSTDIASILHNKCANCLHRGNSSVPAHYRYRRSKLKKHHYGQVQAGTRQTLNCIQVRTPEQVHRGKITIAHQ